MVAGMRSQVNILLVDDRPDGLLTLQAVLASSDYCLVTASCGEEALAHLLDKEFAVILMDVQMPGMDGFETARIIKQRERSRDIPIIFVTAIHRDADYVFRGYGIGAVDYLVKPFDPDALKSKVAVFADLFRKNQKLEYQAERLRISEEKYRVLLATARDAVATLSVERRILSLSPAFEMMTGWEVKDWLGAVLDDLLHPEDRPAFRSGFLRTMKDEGHLVEARLRKKDGTYLVMEASARQLLQEGLVTGIITVIRDVSERKRSEAAARRQQELERSNRELEQFAHICSHDLQEPLRNIRTYAQLLEKGLHGKLNESMSESLDFISKSAARMSHLVRDLFAFSRVDSGEVTLEAVDSGKVCEQALENLQGLIRKNDVKIVLGDLPMVMGSPSLLIQVFQNLIGNATKFRSSEKPIVHISAEPHGAEWQFSVRDNGIGFDMNYADHIFTIFRRLHHSKDYPGTGAGLAICKRILERHGGRIWADSKPGKGATFYFLLQGASQPQHRFERSQSLSEVGA